MNGEELLVLTIVIIILIAIISGFIWYFIPDPNVHRTYCDKLFGMQSDFAHPLPNVTEAYIKNCAK